VEDGKDPSMDNPDNPALVKDVSAADFATAVIERSRALPVVVDFWAAWCAPCRVLGPVIEREIAALGGKVELAKLDTDASPEIAARYAIQGIPAVKAFRDGVVVSEFVGARPAAFVRDWLAALSPPAEVLALEAAEGAARAGDRLSAEPALRKLLDELPARPELDRRLRPRALAILARLLVDAQDVAAAEPVLVALEESGEEADLVRALRWRLHFVQDAARAGGIEGARAAVARDAADREARWSLGAALAVAGQHEPALEQFLELAASARRPRGQDAREAMLALFEALGPEHALTQEYRRRLQIVT